MLFLSSLPSKRFPANGAGERLHARVHTHVRVKIATPEPLPAGGAQHLLPRLVPRQMLLEIFLRGHAPPTDSTDELGLVVSVLHVGLQRVQIFTEMTANVAHYGRCVAVILFHVVIQRFLDFELLAASVAGEVVAGRVQTDVMVLQGAFVVALVLANAAIVQLTAVNLFHVRGQVSTKPECLRTVGAFVTVFLQVLGQVALLQELASTVVAF